MYFGSLPANLASFCALLRREHGFDIGAGELVDAARALDVVKPSSQKAVRAALRAILASDREQAASFDRLFDAFFLARLEESRGEGLAMKGAQQSGAPGDEIASRKAPRARTMDQEAREPGVGAGATVEPLELGDEEQREEATTALARSSYSPLEVESAQVPDPGEVETAWVEAARDLVHRLQLGLSRRWRPSPRGRRFDMRRTLRTSLQTGGETLAPRWLGRPRRSPRFVLFIDGSRSMSGDTRSALQLAVALARATLRLEVFTFSTALERVTNEVRHVAEGRARTLSASRHAWGGGTSIGACFADFVRRFGERLLSRDTIVIVASDGLDVGEPETLRTAIRAMRRRSAALVWLNPLAATPGYEPTALGMSTARPFVTTLASANDPASFARLSRNLRLNA